MKKRLMALTLAAAMAFALGASAVLAENAEKAAEPVQKAEIAAKGGNEQGEAEKEPAAPAQDAAGTLSFENLGDRMRTGFYPMRSLEENVATLEELDYDNLKEHLRVQLGNIAEQQWMMKVYGMGDPYTDAMIQQGYDAVREKFDAIKDGDMQKDNADALRQLRDAESQMIMAGEACYIGLKAAEAQDASLTRTIAKLDRNQRELELRRDLGQVSALSVEQLALGRTQALSRQKTLRSNVEVNLMQLKAMAGAPLDEPLTLNALPRVTAAQLAAMDLEKDLEQAKSASYDLYEAKKTLDEARDEYRKHGYIDPETASYDKMQHLHTWRSAQYTYENTVQSFEMRFRALYARVQDEAQQLEAARAALAAEEKNYAVSALKFEQGNISANALADAKDALSDAKDAVTAAERELFAEYRSYHWAVECGLMNG